MKKLILTTCLTLLSLAANANYINGNKLLDDLTGSNTDRAFALGFVAGVVDSYDGELFCTPRAANLGQLRDVVTQFLVRNPKERHRNAAAIVAIALVIDYPCVKGSGV
jgi:hypothetical protein